MGEYGNSVSQRYIFNYCNFTKDPPKIIYTLPLQLLVSLELQSDRSSSEVALLCVGLIRGGDEEEIPSFGE